MPGQAPDHRGPPHWHSTRPHRPHQVDCPMPSHSRHSRTATRRQPSGQDCSVSRRSSPLPRQVRHWPPVQFDITPPPHTSSGIPALGRRRSPGSARARSRRTCGTWSWSWIQPYTGSVHKSRGIAHLVMPCTETVVTAHLGRQAGQRAPCQTHLQTTPRARGWSATGPEAIGQARRPLPVRGPVEHP